MPTTIKPTGYLTLSEALESVAAVLNVQKYEAQKSLRELLYSGQVPSQIIENSGQPYDIPKYVWGGIQWGEALKSGGVHFEVAAYAPDTHGRVIIPERHLIEALNAVRRRLDAEYQSVPESQSQERDPTYSGLPGRPTPKHLYLAEMKCRAKSGKLRDKVAHEAADLLDWLKEEHPTINPGTCKTIENAIRSDFKKLKAKAQKGIN